MRQASESRKLTVLCVDDEHHVLTALERVLHRLGCQTLLANCAVEALYDLTHENVDVIICDEAMPEIRGIDLLRQAKDIRPTAVRVMLTAHYCDERVVVPAINEGLLFRLLRKPWEEDELVQVLTDALGAHPRDFAKHQELVGFRLRDD